jgi:hypothetical protein
MPWTPGLIETDLIANPRQNNHVERQLATAGARFTHYQLLNNQMNKTNNRSDRIRGHKLLTKALRRKLPPLYASEEQGDEALAQVKYFTPDSNWTWYGVEFDGHDLFFGLVCGQVVELGYFRLSELETLRGPWGLPVERDRFFEPTPLKVIRDYHRRHKNRF